MPLERRVANQSATTRASSAMVSSIDASTRPFALPAGTARVSTWMPSGRARSASLSGATSAFAVSSTVTGLRQVTERLIDGDWRLESPAKLCEKPSRFAELAPRQP